MPFEAISTDSDPRRHPSRPKHAHRPPVEIGAGGSFGPYPEVNRKIDEDIYAETQESYAVGELDKLGSNQQDRSQDQIEQAEENDELEDIYIDSAKSIQAFREFVLNDTKRRQQEAGLSDEEFSQSELYSALQDFEDLMEGMIVVVEEPSGLSEADAASIQRAYDRVLEAETEQALDSAVEFADETDFDPEAYIFTHIDNQQGFTSMERASVNVLRREYKRLVAAGDTGASEEVAQDIKQLVDDLRGVAAEQEDQSEPEDEDGEFPPQPTIKRGDLVLNSLDEEGDSDSITTDDGEDETPSELLSPLYGMKIPDEQSELYEVASFREGLKVAFHHDKYLEQFPQRQVLFTKLIAFLDVIGGRKLSAEETARLHELVIQINDPGYVAEQKTPEDEVGDTDNGDLKYAAPAESSPASEPLILQQSDRDFAAELRTTLDTAEQNSLEASDYDEGIGDEDDYVDESEKAVELSGRQLEKYLQEAVRDIERLKPNFIERLTGDIPSPYEKLSDEKFDEVVEAAQAGNSAYILQWLNDSGIDFDAFYRWMDLVPSFKEENISTAGRTFKEVIDEFLVTTKEASQS